MTYYLCNTCGNLIEMIDDSGNTPVCCGNHMHYLDPKDDDSGGNERHVPFLLISSIDSSNHYRKLVVQVGETPHPMEAGHHINWICVETDKGVHRMRVFPSEKPEATFLLCPDERVHKIYEYCNLHGLWVNDISEE